MKLQTLKAMVLCAATMVAGHAASAQQPVLTPNGSVMVNQGNGFSAVQGPTPVSPSDMVVVNNGTAQISDGTTSVSLTPGNVYTVGNVMGGAPPPAGGGGLGGGLGGGGGGVGGTGGLPAGVIAAGVGIGAAAAIGVAVSSSSSSSTRTPPVSTSP